MDNQQKHLSPKVWVPALVAVALAVAYLGIASAYSIWPFGNSNIEYGMSNVKDSKIPSPGDGEGGGEVANWQTYRNEEFGFEFKYPPDMSDLTTGKGFGDSFEIFFIERPGQVVSLTFSRTGSISEDLEYWKSNGLISEDDFNTKGVQGKKLNIENNIQKSTVYLFQHPNLNTHFSFGIFEGKQGNEGTALVLPELPFTIEQILSTFTFFEPSFRITNEGKLNVYRSTEFDFEIKYPQGWEAFTSRKGGDPNVLIYKGTDPFDTTLQDARISIWPGGRGTEGNISKRQRVDFDLTLEKESEIIQYSLEDGTPWAFEVRFDEKVLPDSWSASVGFLWADVKIPDFSIVCRREGKVMSTDVCNPFGKGDEISYEGKININDWVDLNQVLSTFKFIEPN